MREGLLARQNIFGMGLDANVRVLAFGRDCPKGLMLYYHHIRGYDLNI